jgi:DNA-binding helix-hairpin-helix protein with protein kinase domain
MQNIPQFFDSLGNLISLGQELGRGGEGTVYDLPYSPGNVAKIYHQPVDSKQSAKLSAMVRGKTHELVKVSAWPIDILRDKPHGSVKGLIMPKVLNYREIHNLYSPASRKRDFPAADWAFLIHAARNVASVFEIIHFNGHVIGDVNQGNILVATDATCKLIDCDSFQVVSDGQTYSCDVGVPQFTPPELQNKSFKGTTRTQNHDNFGLALICFHLLFMGRHPFAGRYSGSEDMPIEKAIKEFRFAYGTLAASKKMAPPPNVLGLNCITDQLKKLIERSFGEDSIQQNSRPTPKEWVRELDMLRNSLRSCNQNSNHQYIGTFGSCPWCNLEQASGVLYFLSSFRRVVGDVFDINQVWASIQAIQPPNKIGVPTRVSHTTCTPTPLSPLPSFPALPQIPILESFGPLPAVPTLESFGALPDLPSFPPLPVPLPSNDPPVAIPTITKGSKAIKIFLQIHLIQWIVFIFLMISGLILKNSAILFFGLIYFWICETQSQGYLSRRKHALTQAELYARETIARRECILYKVKLDMDTEMERRKMIIEESRAKVSAEILSRKKIIDIAQKAADLEVKRRQEIINELQKKANAEVERRKRIVDESRAKASAEISRRKTVLTQIKKEWDNKQDYLHRNNWHKDFKQKQQDLGQTKQKWYALKASYDSEKAQKKLQAYLNNFLIQDAQIFGIGEQLKMVLRFCAIETAWDINESRVIQVPGFGPKRTGDLIFWRNGLEAKFHRLSQSEKDSIPTPQLDQKYAQQLLQLERSLRSGSEELQNIKQQIELYQSKFLDQFNQLARKLAQAEADAAVTIP